MEIRERHGFHVRSDYDSIVRWLSGDPKGVPYPNRANLETFNSHVYSQLSGALANSEIQREILSEYKGKKSRLGGWFLVNQR